MNQTPNVCISTVASSRAIKVVLTILLRSGAISEAYKYQSTKHYTYDPQTKKVLTTNTQILVLTPTPKREKLAPQLLDQHLKERAIISNNTW